MNLPVEFTVVVLTYGDHYLLAERCLGSIIRTTSNDSVYVKRIVLLSNAATEPRNLDHTLRHVSSNIECLHYASPVNRFKYPMMRKAFYDPDHPIATSHVVWFDDDSYIDPKLVNSRYWKMLAGSVYEDTRSDRGGDCGRHVLFGSTYRMRLRPNQRQAIEAQSWYDPGRSPVDPQGCVKFCTGGWWIADTAFLRSVDYPIPELKHNGGDVLLGAMVRTTRNHLVHTKCGVHINADADGRESKAPRRGESQSPLWADYDPSQTPDLSHQEFSVTPYDPRGTL